MVLSRHPIALPLIRIGLGNAFSLAIVATMSFWIVSSPEQPHQVSSLDQSLYVVAFSSFKIPSLINEGLNVPKKS